MNLSTAGAPSPLGATVTGEGVNFSLFSRTAEGVSLLLFDREDDTTPAPGSAGRMADRMLGSHEVCGHEKRRPEQSVNFVTFHDAME